MTQVQITFSLSIFSTLTFNANAIFLYAMVQLEIIFYLKCKEYRNFSIWAEVRKHEANNSIRSDLGWISVPLAVETYGCWGGEALVPSPILSLVWPSAGMHQIQSHHLYDSIYQRLNITLV